MESSGLKRAGARLAYFLRHADAALLAAAALLALAAGVHWGANVPARAEAAQLQAQAQAARQGALDARVERERREALSPAARLEAFYRFFPSEDTAPDWLEKIHDAAARQGVQLAQGDYRELREPGGRLLAYQVTYPLKGGYTQLRRFLTQVLRDVPIASLDDVSFRRDAVNQAEVQATVKLTLYLKEAR